MIFDRLGVFAHRARSAGARKAARDMGARWAAAAEADPRLVADLISMGRLLALAPCDATGRLAADPVQIAYEAGRQDLARELLAAMSLTPEDLRSLMES